MLRVGNIENWDEEVGDQIERLLYWKDRREEWLNKCLVALAPLARRHCELPDNRIKHGRKASTKFAMRNYYLNLGRRSPRDA